MIDWITEYWLAGISGFWSVPEKELAYLSKEHISSFKKKIEAWEEINWDIYQEDNLTSVGHREKQS